ncbi:hypothetical protein EIP91_008186 [Steccherinum ochraceum]|uniref:NAD-dependent epimerase/dehydratase domain-containing protein n=1 Tax=Steccherinum ochraceum TaxID=92696 RepID=A0A4R0R364_9APHY|nr:hypothetical protein EIP91_008186 [Steccherinum ochraceum]
MSSSQLILVTGATGFIGAHVVDELLRRGYRVRATTRSVAKGDEMRKDRSHADVGDRLDFAVVGDLTAPNGFDEAVKDVDGIIHCAAVSTGIITITVSTELTLSVQPVAFSFENPEPDVIIPAIEGTKAIISAAAKEPKVKRVVITSSFATVLTPSRGWDPTWKYTAEQWNPITYDEAKASHDIDAYRGAKKYSELYAWDYIRDHKPHFDLATIIPPMVFGPIVHSLAKISDLNVSNKEIWNVASGAEYPLQRVPGWVDVRDLAFAHVEALVRPEASNRRFLVAAPEKYSYRLAADIIRKEFDWAKDVTRKGDEGAALPPSYTLDGETAADVFGFKYRSFKDCIVDAVTQFREIAERE